MIIFLYGPDSYRRQRKLNKIVDEYKQKHSGLSLDYFDLENDGELERFKDFAGQMLIFDNKKLAVLRNVSSADAKKAKEILKNYLKSDNLTILISEDSAPEGFERLLKKALLTEKFDKLDAEKLKFFAQKEIQGRGVNISASALEFLIRNFRGDTWGFMNELEKISLWRAGNKKNIEISDLKTAGDYSGQSPDFFEFINSAGRNYPVRQKIVALENLLLGGEDLIKVFNIMASLKYLPKNFVRQLADYDVAVKSGKLDYEEIFLDLALK